MKISSERRCDDPPPRQHPRLVVVRGALLLERGAESRARVAEEHLDLRAAVLAVADLGEGQERLGREVVLAERHHLVRHCQLHLGVLVRVRDAERLPARAVRDELLDDEARARLVATSPRRVVVAAARRGRGGGGGGGSGRKSAHVIRVGAGASIQRNRSRANSMSVVEQIA